MTAGTASFRLRTGFGFLPCMKVLIPTLPVAIPDEERKWTWTFIFTLHCGAAKGFMNLRCLDKTFWGTAKKCENKNFSYFLHYYNFLKYTEWEVGFGNSDQFIACWGSALTTQLVTSIFLSCAVARGMVIWWIKCGLWLCQWLNTTVYCFCWNLFLFSSSI